MRDAGYYDETYFDGHGKSNYACYTVSSSPFALHADAVAAMLHAARLTGPVLDVGCAKGYLVYLLRQRGIEAYGVDWSEYAIAHANPDVRPYLRRASALELPFGDREFALAVTFDVLEHLDAAGAERALVECARVSEAQLHQVNTGRLPEWNFDGDESHSLQYPLEQWRSLADRLLLPDTVICEPDRRHPLLDAVLD
jgi:SAM-dependent methyltransferase